MTYPDLFHFTCDHGTAALGSYGWLRPAAELVGPESKLSPFWWPADYVWLTIRQAPDRAALGLTSQLLACDRTRYRYRVLDPQSCYRWEFIRGHHLDSPALPDLEDLPGADPASWWVSREPVRVKLDPIVDSRRLRVVRS